MGAGWQRSEVRQPAIAMALSAMGPAILNAEARAAQAAGACLRRVPPARRVAVAKTITSVLDFARKDGTRAGCRGQLTCANAVGLFFATKSGTTESIAEMIAKELKDQDDIDVTPINMEDVKRLKDLTGYDGLVLGLPTWNTGADEARSDTAWDDMIEDIREMDFEDVPVAVFGCGDMKGHANNFCEAIEELHATFEGAGAKMLGYVPTSGYDGVIKGLLMPPKSISGDHFLGLPIDEGSQAAQT